MTAAASRQRDFRTAHGVYFRAMDHGMDVCSRPLVPCPALLENTNFHTHTFIAKNTSHVICLHMSCSGVRIAQSLHKLGYGLDDQGAGV